MRCTSAPQSSCASRTSSRVASTRGPLKEKKSLCCEAFQADGRPWMDRRCPVLLKEGGSRGPLQWTPTGTWAAAHCRDRPQDNPKAVQDAILSHSQSIYFVSDLLCHVHLQCTRHRPHGVMIQAGEHRHHVYSDHIWYFLLLRYTQLVSQPL